MKRGLRYLLPLALAALLAFSACAQAPEEETWDKDMIKAVQEVLNESGFDCGTADGILGSRTAEAVRGYQEAYGLEASGEITEELLVSMGLLEENAPEEENLNAYALTEEETKALGETLRAHIRENWTAVEPFETFLVPEGLEDESQMDTILEDAVLAPYWQCVEIYGETVDELQAQVAEMEEYSDEHNDVAAIIVNAIVEWQEQQEIASVRYQRFWDALAESGGEFLSDFLLPMLDEETELSNEASAEPSSEALTELSGEASAEPSSEALTELPGEASAEPSGEALTELPGEASAEPSTEA